jgi:hypothetical protein
LKEGFVRKTLLWLLAAVVMSAPASAAEWTGKISDAMCGLKHNEKTTGDRECVESCIKRGEAYVFVSGDKIYKIKNQEFAGLKSHAGQTVVLTGEMKDDTVTITKIAIPEPKK